VITNLAYLADEICSGIEIFYSGRTGGQSLRTAFILCDDYTELTSKLYLTWKVAGWSDNLPNGRFKPFPTVLDEVSSELQVNEPALAPQVEVLCKSMKDRRKRRNDFFHSASLLDLNVTERMVLEAYVDLFDYCGALFGGDWPGAMSGARSLETYVLLVRLDHRCLSQPHLHERLVQVLARWPRNQATQRGTGVQVAIHPNDLHLRLCVLNGGASLQASLRALLTP
jgi:hypothetical protein